MTLLAKEKFKGKLLSGGMEATILVRFWVVFDKVLLQMRSNLLETLINDTM